MNYPPYVVIASHGDGADVATLNVLTKYLGGSNIARFHESQPNETEGSAQVRAAVSPKAFVLVGLCAQSLRPEARIRRVERIILFDAHAKKAPYGVFCEKIAYALSHHLYDAPDMRLLVTCEQPSAEQLAMLKRTYKRMSEPIVVSEIPRDAAIILQRMQAAFKSEAT